MSHNHHPHPNQYNRAFGLGILLNALFIVAEIYYGLAAESLALIADAGHNFGDVVTLLLAWGANRLATRKPTPRRTYGFKRATILASVVSATLLLFALGGISWEAMGRFHEPAPVQGKTVMIVAGVGVVINTVTALLFVSGQKHDLNIKAAFLHMAADAIVSLAVVVVGLAILMTGYLWLDPAISLLVVVVILFGTLGLLRDSINLAVDAVPSGIDPNAVRDYLLGVSGVHEVHDFHIWGMSTTQTALTVHLVMPNYSGGDRFLHTLTERLYRQFGIDHATIQIERNDASEQPCHHRDTQCL